MIAPAGTDQKPALETLVANRWRFEPRPVIETQSLEALARGVGEECLRRKRLGERAGIGLNKTFRSDERRQ